MFIRLECAVEQFFVVFRLDSVLCYVSYSNEYFNLLGKSVTNLLYQNIRFLLILDWFLLRKIHCLFLTNTMNKLSRLY